MRTLSSIYTKIFYFHVGNTKDEACPAYRLDKSFISGWFQYCSNHLHYVSHEKGARYVCMVVWTMVTESE